MWTTLAVVALGLVVMVLVTPLDLSLRCERRPELRYRLAFRWLFGLVGTEMDSSRPKDETPKPTKPKGFQKAKKPRGEKRHRNHVGAMLMTRGFLRGAARLLRRLARAPRIRIPFLWLRAGLEDPADTGILSAWLLPVSGYFAARGPGRFDVAPEFSGETLQFAVHGDLRIVPARVLWPFIAFGLSPSTVRGLIALRTGRVR